ncbi:hypothetical protein H9P43_007565 [Blastocladiella emersonii ATCC 22665]|nr:hypothetical protein H9P43_007565 [Blastocladiella emersonii ATCC 22665]
MGLRGLGTAVKDSVKDVVHGRHGGKGDDKSGGDSGTASAGSTSTSSLPTGAALSAPRAHRNGRKKALFIGILYTGTESALRGCVNDVDNLSNFLIDKHGYKRENCKFLTDREGASKESLPTVENMIKGIDWLVADAREGDTLFFHYSGHGASVKDASGDEVDGMDEVLIPLDFKENGVLLDDDLHAKLVAPLPEGVTLHCVMDCCMSGSNLDMPYTYSVDGNLEITFSKNPVRDGFRKLKEARVHLKTGNALAAIDTFKQGFHLMTRRRVSTEAAAEAEAKTQRERTSRADVIAFSGCRDDQTSADAQIEVNGEKVFTGAMSWALREALTEQPKCTYTELLRDMRKLMAGKYMQVPQLSAGRLLDLNTPVQL